MAKAKKKRTKQYRGADAKQVRPTAIRVAAVRRNRPQQWWHDNRKRVRTVTTVVVVALVLIWLLVELVRAFTR